MDDAERENGLRELARKLFFTMEKHGTQFSLTRDIGDAAPVRHDDLTLEEVEEVLTTWKLRGLHGG